MLDPKAGDLQIGPRFSVAHVKALSSVHALTTVHACLRPRT